MTTAELTADLASDYAFAISLASLAVDLRRDYLNRIRPRMDADKARFIRAQIAASTPYKQIASSCHPLFGQAWARPDSHFAGLALVEAALAFKEEPRSTTP